MKSYIGISRDHSGSMQPHRKNAAKDYNITLAGIQEAAKESGLETLVSLVKCGVGHLALVQEEYRNVFASKLLPIVPESYIADGSGTPLWDSVGQVTEILESVKDSEASYLVLVITDGLENRSKLWTADRLRNKILELQATDLWSFVFRVPPRYRKQLSYLLGIPEGNILEWEQTDRGFEVATQATQAGIAGYYRALSSGVHSTTRFYADLPALKSVEVQTKLEDVSNKVVIWTVPASVAKVEIRPFCERMLGTASYRKGFAFYQVVKPETVQDHKEFCIVDRRSGEVYTGAGARDLLGLPRFGSVRFYPGRSSQQYDLFIQSTSVNRILPPGSKVLYFLKA